MRRHFYYWVSGTEDDSGGLKIGILCEDLRLITQNLGQYQKKPVGERTYIQHLMWVYIAVVIAKLPCL